MDTIKNHVESVYEKAKQYTETSLELYKLNAINTTADVVSSLVSRIVLVTVFSIFTLFVNIAISLLIGKYLNDYYLGFLIVSMFYLAVGLVLYFFNDKFIIIPINNIIIGKLLNPRKIEMNLPNTAESDTI